jgi:hypothetical protein
MGNMRTLVTAAVVLLLGATAAHAKLEIKDIKAVHGMYGPERKDLDVLPGDELFFRFTIDGVEVDAEGKVNCLLTVHLKDANGKELLNQNSPLQGVLALGGKTLVSSAYINFGDAVAAGAYTLTVTVEDKQGNAKAAFERKLKCVPAQFAIVAPRFFHDADNKAPSAIGGMVGESLHFRLKSIGFERTGGKIDNEMLVDVLDGAGKSVLTKPIKAELITDDAETVKKTSSLIFRGDLALNRAGTFTLRITVTDRLAKRSAKFEAPLKVIEP